MPQYNSWYCLQNNTYLVDENILANITGYDNIKSIDELFAPESSDNKVVGEHRLIVYHMDINYNDVAEVVEEDGTTKTFRTLEQAVEYANTQSREVLIRMTGDTTETIHINDTDTDIIIDLNGHTITNAPNYEYAFKIITKLTINDSSAGKTGKIISNDFDDTQRAFYVNGGILILNGGTVSGFHYESGAAVYADTRVITKTNNIGNEYYTSHVEINDDAVIENCDATGNGGAVYFTSNNLSSTYTEDTNIFNDRTLIVKGTIRDCTAALSGGGIYFIVTGYDKNLENKATLNIDGATIENCVSQVEKKADCDVYYTGGGGVYVYCNHHCTVDFDMKDSTVENCSAVSGGGGIMTYSRYDYCVVNTDIVNTTITGCTSEYVGGGIFFQKANRHYMDCEQNVSGCTIEDCQAFYGGGIGIHCVYGDNRDNAAVGKLYEYNVTVNGGTVIKNCKATNNNGGGIYYYKDHWYSYGKIDIYDVKVESCYAKNAGGGIYLYRPGSHDDATDTYFPFTLGRTGYETIIKNNTAYVAGGGVYSNFDQYNNLAYDNKVIVDSVTFDGNRTTREKDAHYGAMYLRCARAELKNCIIKNNVTYSNLSGIRVEAIDIELDNCEAYNNTTNGDVSGISLIGRNDNALLSRNDSKIIVNNCKSHNNTVKGGNSAGLHINSDSTKYAYIENCEFYDNVVSGTGAGLYFTSLLGLHIKDTKIYDNTSNYSTGPDDSGYGAAGGAYIYNIVNVYMDNVEVYRNTSKSKGGGITFYNCGLAESKNVNIHDNIAEGDGGGVCFIITSARDINVNDFTLENNKSNRYHGGGMYIYRRNNVDVSVNITNSVFRDNTAISNGGGLCIARNGNANIAEWTISDSEFVNNIANYGGGIYEGHWVHLKVEGDSFLNENTALIYGGGMYVEYEDTHFEFIKPSKIYGNHSLLGQDFYLAYNASYKDCQTHIYDVGEMFENDDAMQGNGIHDEQTLRVYQNMSLRFSPLNKSYALRVDFTNTNEMIAVSDGKGYSTIQEAINYISMNNIESEVIIVSDVIENVEIPAGCKAKVNLNGYTVKGNGEPAFTCKGELIIDDTDKSGSADFKGNQKEYASKTEDGERTIGTITGNGSGTNGAVTAVCGGVFVAGGNVVMKNGQLSECRHGAVRIDIGTFELAGGKICNNSSTHGSAVRISSVSGTFIMSGGEICHNTATGLGTYSTSQSGAIYNLGNVMIYSGKLHNNTSNCGGAIFNGGSGKVSFSKSEGKERPVVCDNSAALMGGAIFTSGGTVTIDYAEFLRNSAKGTLNANVTNSDLLSYGSGGAILVWGGIFSVSEDTVMKHNNANARGGAIYQRYGTVNIFGGEFTLNKALYGGGLAQNPVTGGCIMNITDGKIYRNTALSAYGNDLYSAYEGTNSYEANYVLKKNVPQMNVIAARRMNLENYNFWKDDKYLGDILITNTPSGGQYINSEIKASNNLALTAIYYKAEEEAVVDTNFSVMSIKLLSINNNVEKDGITDGDGQLDNGVKETDTYDNAKLREKSAKDILDAGDATYSEETYIYNGNELNYIEYNGKLYEQDQAVEWWAGNDSSYSNSVIRSYDKISYSIYSNISATSGSENIDSSKIYRRWIKIMLPCSPNEAEFVYNETKFTTSPKITSTIVNGENVQILTGYWDENILNGGLSKTNIISVQLYAIKNGRTIKPVFESWVDGNIENEQNHATCASKTITVSAAPKYNIDVRSNSALMESIHHGYFDIVNGYEIPEQEYVEMTNEEKKNVVYGAVFGYGVTVELYNDPGGKGLKGVELPENNLEFDLSFKGKLRIVAGGGSDLKVEENPLYIWAYKPNDTDVYGYAINSYVRNRNMNWNDDDDIYKFTKYAYNAAPYNTGGGESGCYNGGQWYVSGSQPNLTDEFSTVHVKISNYTFPNSTNVYPSRSSKGNDGEFSKSYMKPFSAGYIQVIYPIDYNDVDKSKIYRIEMTPEATASNFDVVSVSGQKPEDIDNKSELNTDEKKSKDIRLIQTFFNYEDDESFKASGLAKNERIYEDNYCVDIVQSDFIIKGEGCVKYCTFPTWKDTGIVPLDSDTTMNTRMVYHSKQYRSDDKSNREYFASNDPLYSSDYWDSANIEYYYMTAVNMLHKFDADVFTPYGGGPVIDVAVVKKNSCDFCSGAFNISIGNNEEATEWSKDAAATKSYNVTIMYAAKKDGKNWTKIDKTIGIMDGFDDGGSDDMYNTSESDLLYFETLDELYTYFKETGINDDAKCVAILYEIRNCCIRNSRSVSATAKMKVTDDYKYIGNTYCSTNEVFYWETYRPHYKKYYFSKEGVKPYTHQDIWHNHVFDDSVENAIAYGYNPDTMENLVKNKKCNPYDYTANSPDRLNFYEVYNNRYRKAQYSNGKKVESDNGETRFGSTLLMSSAECSVELFIKTKQKNSNAVKTEYYLSKGERYISYQVHPLISLIEESKSSDFIQSAAVRTKINIDVYIPEHLSLDVGSINIDYDDRLFPSDYTFLEWEQSISDYGKGQIMSFSTEVQNISLKLPVINFSCNIGDAGDPTKDINTEISTLVVKADIGTKYDLGEDGKVNPSTNREDSQKITVYKENNRGVTMWNEKRIIDVREPIKFYMTYNNYEESAISFKYVNVLPYNSDNRGTKFTGGYRIQSVDVYFFDDESFDKNKTGFELKYLKNQINPYAEKEENLSPLQNALINKIETSTETITKKVGEEGIIDEAEKCIHFPFEKNESITLATDESATAILMNFKEIAKKSGTIILFNLSPLEDDDDDSEFIKSEAEDIEPSKQIQTSGCAYVDSTFAISTNVLNANVTNSNNIEIDTIDRVISGTVFIDRDRDGVYRSEKNAQKLEEEFKEFNIKYLPEYTISGINVYLYEADPIKDEYGIITGYEIGEPAKDINHFDIPPVETDKNGNYIFDNLGEGEYFVLFDDNAVYGKIPYHYNFPSESEYLVHPLDFDMLSVTQKSDAGGNISVAEYGSNHLMKNAYTDVPISLISSDSILESIYEKGNCNLGLYYDEFSITKEWHNMVQGMPDGTSLKFNVNGVTFDEDEEEEEVYSGNIIIKRVDEEEIKGSFDIEYKIDEMEISRDNVTVEEAKSKSNGNIYTWTFTENIMLPANYGEKEIKYIIKEADIFDCNEKLVGDALLQNHFKLIEENSCPEHDEFDFVYNYKAVNNQRLGSITIITKTGNETYMANDSLELSIYQIGENPDTTSDNFKPYNENVGTIYNKPYKQGKNKEIYKVIFTDSSDLEKLGDIGLYDDFTNRLSMYNNISALNSETPIYREYDENGDVIYYFYNSVYVNELLDEECEPVDLGEGEHFKNEKVSAVTFDNLPMYDENGLIYYTIRQTKVPEFYYSIDNFSPISYINLMYGYNKQGEYLRDIDFILKNTKLLYLPVTGERTMTVVVICGSIMITSGSLFIIMYIRRKRKKRTN